MKTCCSPIARAYSITAELVLAAVGDAEFTAIAPSPSDYLQLSNTLQTSTQSVFDQWSEVKGDISKKQV